MSLDKEALEYHSKGKPGKLEVTPTKECDTEKALSLAYSPGVAAPCKEIAADESKVFDYTNKGNLVAVISNGTAVLGLGNIGPSASKPVMEGKAVLFKQFAGIDVFDIELNANGVEEFIQAVKAMEPTFGGINLEDIKAPECFEIEQRLKKEMNIPVFHDDQHGTAIISGAALINACTVSGKKMDKIRLVVNGAGASAIACTKIFKSLGVRPENLLMCDSKGVIYKGRTEGMNAHKEEFAVETDARSLQDACKGADVFVGLSVGGALTPEMLETMAERPIVFAMANPDPEIDPAVAKQVRPDVIIATGRSDHPNQVNNVLGFPSIFRGALDVRATGINEEMKLAAVDALARLAREDVPEKVSDAYGGRMFQFGPDYIIPKPFDHRVLLWVAPAVAKAAATSGVARQPISDFAAYRDKLEVLQGPAKVFIRSAINQIHKYASKNNEDVPRIVFPEGTSKKILKAVAALKAEHVIQPILLGEKNRIKKRIDSLELEKQLEGVPILNPAETENFDKYVDAFYEMRQRKGVMQREAERLLSDPNYYGSMMVKMGDADGVVTGATQNFADSVRPILQAIGTSKDDTAAGVNVVFHEDRMLLFADTTVHLNPDAQTLAKIAVQCSRIMEYFGVEPRVAMLSFSNFFGKGETPLKMQRAVEELKKIRPDIVVDGDIQADAAINPEITKRIFPFSALNEGANILLFPNLEASNIAYKLVQQLGKGEVIGPFLMGVRRSSNVLQRTTTVDAIIDSVVLTALEAQYIKERLKQKK